MKQTLVCFEKPCCETTYKPDNNGYTKLKGGLAHRLIWQHTHGPIPTGLVIDHLCNNRRCIEITHLRLTTHKENVTASARNTFARGFNYCNKHGLLQPSGVLTYQHKNGRTQHRCRQCEHERDKRRQPIKTAAHRAKRASQNASASDTTAKASPS